MKRSRLLALTLVVCVLAGSVVLASASSVQWPRKPVQIIVPYGAGGDTDFNARVLAERLNKVLGGNFVVVNMAGTGGATGARYVKDAANDGYTVLFHHTGFLVSKLSGVSDFGLDAYEFVCIAGRSAGNIITLHSKHGITNLQELIEYSQANPGKLKIAANTGATTHATALMLRDIGAKLNIVDSGGAADRIVALLGGHVDIIVNPYGTLKDYLETGELVGIALDSDVQPATIPDIPIGAAQGYDIGLPFYYFLAFPKGTDPAIVEKLSSAVKEIVANDAGYAETIMNAYLQTPTYYDAEEGLRLMQEAYEKLSRLDFTD
ncbi:MAG: tripartite tricarboxylate transporter substrate binding protein [Limnochordia bacterium]|nr:tripartite tricarboxylate transporter substrate binding protein [Bacillota bacterium]